MNLANYFNQQQFDQYVAYLKSTGLSQTSIQRKLSSIATFQKFLIKKNIIPSVSKNTTAINTSNIIVPPKNKFFNLLKSFSLKQIPQTSKLYKYLIIASLVIIISGIGITLYRQAITKAKKNLAYTTSSNPVYANRFLSFQGRLTDSAGNPITSSTNIVFDLYNTENVGTGTSLYTSSTGNSQVVTPDDNGIFAVTIGKTHGTEIPNSVFTQNSAVYLQITAGGEVMDPRQPIATVAYAINAETLQGLPPSASGLKDTVLVIDGDGNLNLGETSPTIKSTSGTLGIEGQSILLTASNGSGGDIEINPDASGIIKLTTEGNGSTAIGGFIDATNANLSTGNLFNADINNTNRGYNFISFNNYDVGTTNSSTRFSVDAYGNTYIAGTLSPTNISIGNTLLTSSAAELNLLDGLVATNGSIIYGNGSNLVNSSVGTSGQLLMSNGSAAPSWINPSNVGTTYAAGIGISLSDNNIFSLNLSSANTWTGLQNFSAGATISNLSIGGTLTLGQGANDGYILTSDASGNSYWAPNTGVGTTYAAGNGLSLSSTTFKLGGALTENTRLNIGSTEVLYLSDTGNVGIGTTDISGKLTIAGNSGSSRSVSIDNREIKFRGDGVAHMSILGPDTGNSFITFQNTSANSNTGTAGTDLFTILSSGNVGIGSTNPSQRLQVTTSGANDIQYGIRLQNPNNSTTGASVGIAFANDTDNNLAKGGLVYTGRDGYGKGDFLFLQNTNNDLSVPTLSDAVMSITNTGYVGIGTTSPSKKLDVIGDGSFSTNLNIGGTLTLSQGASSGYILTSDASGNASWTAANSSGVGTTYAAGNGLSLASNIFSLDLGSTNTWTGLQNFSAGATISNLSIGGTFLSVGSTNLVTNLNANYLNGIAYNNLPYVNNTTDSTLTRSGSGPYTLGINLTNANTWTGLQNFSAGATISNLSIGGTIALSQGASSGYVLTSDASGNASWIDPAGIGGTDTLTAGVGISISNSGVGRTIAVDYDATKLALSGNKLTLNLGATNVWTALTTFTNGIGVSNTVDFTNNLNVGGTAYFASNVGIGTTNPSAKLHVVGKSYFTDNIGIGITPSATSGKLLSIGDHIYANSNGEIYASSIFDAEDNTAFLDAANSSANTASLSLYATGSIRFNTATDNTHLINGAATRIQNFSNGLLLGVSSSNTQSSSIAGWDNNLFLNTSGSVGIGTTNPGAKLEVAGETSLISNNSGSITVRAQTNGVSLASGATSWASASDIRLKNVISNINNPIDRVMQLNPIIFSWKNDPTNTRQVGLIAQDVQDVLPEAIEVNKEGYLGVRYTEIIPLLTASIQELNNRLQGISITNTGLINIDYNISDETLASLGYDQAQNEINSATYSLKDFLGNTVNQISQFSQIVVAKIQTGLISTTNLIAQNAIISNLKTKIISVTDLLAENATISNLKSQKITTDEIVSPVANITNLDAVNLTSLKSNILELQSDTANISSLFTQDVQSNNIKTENISADYLESTSADISNLSSQNIETSKIGASDVFTDNLNSNTAYISNLYAENNNSTEINSEKISTNNLTATEASVDILYADKIYSKNGSIGDLLTDKISSLREEIQKTIAQKEASQSALLAETDGWYTDVSNDALTIPTDLTLSNNLVVGAQLLVNGNTQLGNTFINGIFNAGDIAIKDNLIETTNTALYIQPSQTGSVHVMGDTLVIADNGNVVINGNLSITGSFAARNITADEINTNKLTSNELKIATDSASTIIASNSDTNTATNSAKINSNATAGTATLPAGVTELIISTNKITSNSMVYLTPLASTQNQVLYVKSKDTSSFTISLDNPLGQDIQINWWIIN